MHTTTQRIAENGTRFSVAAAASRAWRAAAAAIAPARAAADDPLAALLPAGSQRYVRRPWSTRDLARIDADERVLVLGVGLAAINLVTALQHQWHSGLIRLVTREEPLPQRLAELREAGRLDVLVGFVTGASSYGDSFVVDVLPSGRRLHSSERYDWIVDCT